jgi:hypothetical protein
MNRHAVTRLAAFVTALIALTTASARAQAPAGDTHVAISAGIGGAFASAQQGVDRDVGPMVLGGIEFRQPWRSGLLGRMGLRAEAGFSVQGLSSSGGFVDGDVQTAYGAVLASLALIEGQRFDAYAIAGPSWSHLSTKFSFDAPANETPGAAFEQTSHETAPGVVLGAGAGWHIRWATVRAEARWMSVNTAETTTMVPVVLSLAVPLGR